MNIVAGVWRAGQRVSEPPPSAPPHPPTAAPPAQGADSTDSGRAGDEWLGHG